MKRHVCPRCAFSSLIDPGDRCPGCGYLFSYMKRQPVLNVPALRRAQEEIPIRRLTCAIVRQDNANGSVLAECTITNRNLRLRPGGTLCAKGLLSLPKVDDGALEIVLPYHRMTDIRQGTHRGRQAQFFTYCTEIGALNLWFFVDKGVASRHPGVDEEVRDLVLSLRA